MKNKWIALRALSYRAQLSLVRRKDRYRPILSKRRREFYHAMWAAGATRVGAEFEVIEGDFCHIWRNGRSAFFSECQTVLDGGVSQRLVSNKFVAHRVLRDLSGYQEPEHVVFGLKNLARATSFMSQANCPIVVKPSANTGAGNGVATGIDTYKKLVRAALNASLYGSGDLVAEHQNSGASYRLLFLDGQLLHTVRRDPPAVVGDGHSTIAELVDNENQRRTQNVMSVAFSPLDLDEEMRVTLSKQQLNSKSVLEKDQQIMVKLVSNQNSAGENVEDGPVCDDIKQLGMSIANRLRLRFMGMDLITPNLEISLLEAGGVINDINSSPGLHHHYLCNPLGADPMDDIGRIVVDPIIEKSLTCEPAEFHEGDS